MGERGGGRELKEALSLFRFHLSPFPQKRLMLRLRREGRFFFLSCETSLIHADNHVIPRAALKLKFAHSFAHFSSLDFSEHSQVFLRGSGEKNRPYSRCPSFLHALTLRVDGSDFISPITIHICPLVTIHWFTKVEDLRKLCWNFQRRSPVKSNNTLN